MPDDARILELVEEALGSNLPPEEVCAHDPELLADVKACLDECRNVRLMIDDLFPAATPAEAFRTPSPARERLRRFPAPRGGIADFIEVNPHHLG